MKRFTTEDTESTEKKYREEPRPDLKTGSSNLRDPTVLVVFSLSCFSVLSVSSVVNYLSSSNFSDAEFRQYRSPVGRGPSSKTCPRWPSHRAQRISVRTIP